GLRCRHGVILPRRGEFQRTEKALRAALRAWGRDDDRAPVELAGLPVRIHGLGAPTLLRVALAQPDMRARVEGIERECRLIRGEGAVDLAFRSVGIAEPDVGISIEMAQLDRRRV